MPYYNAEFYRDATFHDNIEVDGTVEADKVGSANNPIGANGATAIAPSDDLVSILENASAGDVFVLSGAKYDISTVPDISEPITILGHTANVTGAINNAPDTNLDQLNGSIIEQQSAGADVLNLTGEAQQVNLKDLLLTWDSSIRDSDTGHGIASNQPSDPDGNYPTSGPFNCVWDNISVVGNDGNHYGARLVNPQQNVINNFYVDGGGGMEFVQDHGTVNYGNTTITGFYCKLKNDSADADQAHGISYVSNNGLLNLIAWMRPQVNTALESVTGQKHVSINENGGQIDAMAYIAVNMEQTPSNNSSGIDAETGSYLFLPTRIGPEIPINGTLQMLSAGNTGSTDIRADSVESNVLTANTSIDFRDGNGLHSVLDYGAQDTIVQNEQASNNPQIKLLDTGQISITANGSPVGEFRDFSPGPGLYLKNSRLAGVRSSPTALSSGDLESGEIAMDESNGRLVWKDASGSAYYVSGTAL